MNNPRTATSLCRDCEPFDTVASNAITALQVVENEDSDVGTYEWNMQTDELVWNKTHEDMWGYGDGEFDGTFASFAKKVHPDDLLRIREKIEYCVESRQSWQEEFRIIVDGETKWVANSGDFEYDEEGEPLYLKGIVMEPTKRKAMETELEERRVRLSSLIDSVDGVVFEFDVTTMQFTFVSQQAEELLGFPAEQWLEEEGFWPNHLHPDDQERAVKFCTSMTAKCRNHRFIYRMIAADGSVVWIDDVVSVVAENGEPTQLRGIMTDITAKIMAEKKISRSNRRFRALIENNPSCIQLIDKDLRTIYASPAVANVLGINIDELIGQKVFEYAAPENAKAMRRRLSDLRGFPDQQASLQWQWTCPDGNVFSFEGVATNLLDDPAVEAIVLNYRNITDKVRLEEGLRQAQKMEAVGRLAGGVAHDFNNILTTIGGYGSLISAESDVSDTVSMASREILDATDRAAGLTRQLLAFGRRQVMQPEMLNINRLLEKTLDMLGRIVGEDISMRAKLSSDTLYAFADPVMIDQVILNLVVNSRDAIETGHGEICISTGDFVDEKGDRYVYVDVSDNGVGIPEDAQGKIFDPFFTTKEQGRGTGLGLATVFGIVEQHKGKLSVESEPGKGTSIRIFLPESVHEKDQAEMRRTPDASKVITGNTILLAEDEKSVRNLVQIILKREGYEVFAAEDGIKALEIWEEKKEDIDLLLTDIIMPGGLTGFELASRLREETPELKVAFMSGYSADIAGKEIELEEGQNFIQKPASRDKLLAIVREGLKHQEMVELAN